MEWEYISYVSSAACGCMGGCECGCVSSKNCTIFHATDKPSLHCQTLVLSPLTQMVQYRHKLMQTLQALKKGSTSVEGVLEAFSMTDFLKEFDSIVEELYAEFAPSVVEQVIMVAKLSEVSISCVVDLWTLSTVYHLSEVVSINLSLHETFTVTE